MHRHGYKGRKLHRETDQRRALIKGLADSLVKYESIETTLPKAKEIVPYVERLLTKAKKGDLHSRRQVISALQTVASANKLMDEIAPKYKGQTSGHLRITKTTSRRGDNALLAKVSFVEPPKAKEAKPAPTKTSPASKPKLPAKPKSTTKTAAKGAKK